MRQIKFRAWDKKNKIMYYQEGIAINIFEDNFFHIENAEEKILIQPEHVELMQFIGIKDMNDKDIYEGDAIQQRNNRGDGKGTFIFIGVVEYECVSFFVRCLKGGDIGSHYYFSYYDSDKPVNWEIIGNIYENPELSGEEEENEN